MILLEIQRRSAAGYPNGVYHFECPLCVMKDENLASGFLATEAMNHYQRRHSVSSHQIKLMITDEGEKMETGVWVIYHYEVGPVLIARHLLHADRSS